MPNVQQAAINTDQNPQPVEGFGLGGADHSLNDGNSLGHFGEFGDNGTRCLNHLSGKPVINWALSIGALGTTARWADDFPITRRLRISPMSPVTWERSKVA